MLIGIIIGVAGLACVGFKYSNRDNLAGPVTLSEAVFYVVAACAAIGVGVAVAILIIHGKDACGPHGNGSRCS